MNEPKVVINGKALSQGHTLTLRMALGCFKLDLHEEPQQTRLGSQQIAEHLRHLEELNELIGGLST